jgi:hypothetical protein
MLELDHIAVTTLASDEPHAAFAGSAYRGARGRGVIDALVRTDAIQHGMLARKIETRADARELHWRTHEGLAQAFAIGIVVLAAALAVDVAHGPVLAACVDELRRQDVADA